MKLKIKNFNWLAGKPVAILNDKTAKKLNVFVDDRIAIMNSKKVYSVIDIFPRLVKENEIGLSYELSKVLKLKEGSSVEVGPSQLSGASFLIRKKMSGEALLEKADENPFLVKFYQNPKKYGFQAQIFFLLRRYRII